MPLGTVTSNVHVALSVGWSLAGSHVLVPSGSLTAQKPSSPTPTKRPARVKKSPDGGIVDVNSTEMSKGAPAGCPLGSATTSSSPACEYARVPAASWTPPTTGPL